MISISCGARLETTGEAITNIKSERRVKAVGKDEGRRKLTREEQFKGFKDTCFSKDPAAGSLD